MCERVAGTEFEEGYVVEGASETNNTILPPCGGRAQWMPAHTAPQ